MLPFWRHTHQSDAPTQAGATGWWPGLDGLRGVAVLAVLVYHQDPSWLPGGFLGVSLFFTLSGFLLTTLVVNEHTSTGRVDLRRFWARRVRRLAPVALVGLVVALVVTVATVEAARIGQIARDIDFAALDVANWRFITHATTYADTLHPPSPVLHFWSLAVEEQFYVLFPIVAWLSLRRSRRCFALVLGGVALLSVAQQLRLHDHNRVYFGTDTRVAELAIGCLAALAWKAWGHRARRLALDASGVIAVSLLLLAWRSVTFDSAELYRGGLVAHALLSCAVIAAAIGGAIVPRVFSWSPFRALGRVSYGVYVLHFPLFLLLTGDRVGVHDEVALFAIRIGVVLVAAAFVHRLIESPVRWRRALPSREGALAFVSGVVAVVVLASGVIAVNHDAEVEQATGLHLVRMSRPADGTVTVTAPAPSTSLLSVPASGTDPAPVAAAPVSTTTPPPPAAPHLFVVGDSTALSNGVGLQQWASQTGAADVDLMAALACTFYAQGLMRLREGWDISPTEQCNDLIDSVLAASATMHPDVIVVFIDNLQLADWQLPGESTWCSVGDAAFDAQFAAAADNALTRLESIGVPILLADVPVPQWVIEDGRPGTGAPTTNSVTRTERLNELTATVASSHPLVRILPYAEHLENPDGTVDTGLRPDGLHLTPDAAVQITQAWLLDEMISAYQSVTRAVPASEARPTTWAPT